MYIIVGMLGCFFDYINCCMICLNNVNMVVMDEVDEMLNMGFIDDIEFIFLNVLSEY